MQNPLQKTKYLTTEVNPLRLADAQAEVTFIGRSNVGKSSVICALCENNRLARVSKTPGRTRTINVFEVIRGKWLVDLPGYGFAAASEEDRLYWAEMIGHYLGGRPSLKQVFLLLDSQVGPSPIDSEMLTWLTERQIPFTVVCTKVDRLSQNAQKSNREEIAQLLKISAESLVWVSAKEGYGMKNFRQKVMQALNLK